MTGAEASEPDAAQPVNGDTQDPSAGLDITQLQKALAEAQRLANSHKDGHLRAAAEVDNIRRRAQRDVENASRYGLEKFAVELLPVLDSLQLAVTNTTRVDAKSLIEGQAATLKLLAKAFTKLDIREITAVGEPFDPARHEAVMAQESTTAEPNSVLQVLQPAMNWADGCCDRRESSSPRRLESSRIAPSKCTAGRTRQRISGVTVHGKDHRHRPGHDQLVRRHHGRWQNLGLSRTPRVIAPPPRS